jgi:hypothetical protein
VTDGELDHAAGSAAPLIDRFARFGFAAKGIVTILIGALALRYALGRGGAVTGPEGAIKALLDEPFGGSILAVLAAGLAGYALWMFVETFLDPERKGAGFQGLAERVAFFVTGIVHLLLSWAALELLLGRGSEGGPGLNDLAASVLTPRVGRWLVGLIGAIVMIAGLLQLRLGLTAGFRHVLRPAMSVVERAVTIVSGCLGYLMLGVLSLLVGYSLVQVAIQYDPARAGGWNEALWLIAGLVEGRWLLGVASVGLILYGFYFVLLMRYRAL